MKKPSLLVLIAAAATGARFASATAMALAPTPAQTEAWLANVAVQEQVAAETAIDQAAAELAQVSAAEAAAQDQVAANHAASRKSFDVARAVAAEVAAVNNLGTTFRAGRGARAGRVLVIPKDVNDTKGRTELEEDLIVMAHILDKAVSRDDRSSLAMGINVVSWSARAPATPENLYLDGYGAVFFESVDFPLLPPPARETDAAAKEKTSTEWEDARREITQPARGSGGDSFYVVGDAVGFGSSYGEQSPMKYDEGRVDELKRDLVAALKNAAHIRKLRSDETVTVVVTGLGAGGAAGTARSAMATTGTSPRSAYAFSTPAAGEWKSTSPPARLVVRARKSDADAFQNGTLSLDEFRKKVTLITY